MKVLKAIQMCEDDMNICVWHRLYNDGEWEQGRWEMKCKKKSDIKLADIQHFMNDKVRGFNIMKDDKSDTIALCLRV